MKYYFRQFGRAGYLVKTHIGLVLDDPDCPLVAERSNASFYLTNFEVMKDRKSRNRTQ